MLYPVIVFCRMMRVISSACYAWKKRPKPLISADVLHLNRRIKMLFKRSQVGLGNRRMECPVRVSKGPRQRACFLFCLTKNETRYYILQCISIVSG
jgi:hypothetical protein